MGLRIEIVEEFEGCRGSVFGIIGVWGLRGSVIGTVLGCSTDLVSPHGIPVEPLY